MGLNSNQISKYKLPAEHLCASGLYFEDLFMLPTPENLLI